MSQPRSVPWIVGAVSLPMFMVSLNNLVVINALPYIGKALSTDTAGLQWVMNGYVLAFAGFLLTAAGLGDRYGRRRVFVGGIVLFALGSIACGLADSVPALVAGRVVQGIGAAAVQPLSLTLLAGAVPASKRGMTIGLWGAVNGLGIALGPLVGGAVTETFDWRWVFLVNLPVVAVAIPLVLAAVRESTGADRELDVLGMTLVTAAVTLLVWAVVNAGNTGWLSGRVLGGMAAALVPAVLFAFWERKAKSPLLPLRFYRIPAFTISNLVVLAMFFGVFGSIFFVTQFMQGPLGFSPLQAGIRTLPWTAMPIVVAPPAGRFTDRFGGGPLMAIGLSLQGAALAWIAVIANAHLEYVRLIPPMMMAGVGLGLVLPPAMTVVLGSVRPHEHGKASGANNTIREIGGALGVAVLSTVFRARFDGTPTSAAGIWPTFVRAMVPALWVGIAVTLVGALIALFVPTADEDHTGGEAESATVPTNDAVDKAAAASRP
jgi:EmrB/QacA subfamily drug resistance transporter